MIKSQLPNENRVTIKDVALAAGVSVTTVSNLLNGRMYAMAEETRKRIEEAIASMDYHPNQAARSLVTNHTATIGLILSEIETPLFLQAINFIEPIARNAGYTILFGNSRSTEDGEHVFHLLLQEQVDGIIFLSVSTYLEGDFLSDLPTSAPPIVLVNRTTRLKGFDQVNWDNVGGIVNAVDYLVQLGHRRIAHLKGPLSRRSTDERLQGYRSGLGKNGLVYDEAYVRSGDFTISPEIWHQSTLELLNLPTPPTAIVAADDIVAASVIRTVQRAGLRVPEDISVMGIDDQPDFCTYLNPALTTVQLPVVEAGKLAIHMLLDHMTGQRKKVKRVLLPCPLILRESCGPNRKALIHD
jgi:DNA-binding LacI/PurR family transcriptional regulator